MQPRAQTSTGALSGAWFYAGLLAALFGFGLFFDRVAAGGELAQPAQATEGVAAAPPQDEGSGP